MLIEVINNIILQTNWQSVIFSVTGFIVGSVVTYFVQRKLFEKQYKYQKEMSIYEKIYDEAFSIKLNLRRNSGRELIELDAILKKNSIIRLPDLKNNLKEFIETYKLFSDNIDILILQVKHIIHEFVPYKQYYDEEVGYVYVPYSISDELALLFCADNPEQALPIIEAYINENKKNYYEDIVDSDEPYVSSKCSKKEILQFIKIFKDKRLKPYTQKVRDNYLKMRRLNDTIIEKTIKKLH